MADLVNLTLETLPDAWRGALTLLHQRQPARGGGSDAVWTLAEDAMILHTRRCNPDVKRQPCKRTETLDRRANSTAAQIQTGPALGRGKAKESFAPRGRHHRHSRFWGRRFRRSNGAYDAPAQVQSSAPRNGQHLATRGLSRGELSSHVE
jgi:hypothetical protein